MFKKNVFNNLGWLKYLLLGGLLSLLVACESSVNHNNFNKIGVGMNFKEVTKILGKPASTSSVNLVGVSGTTATWESGNARITIQFVNDKVTVKNFKKGE